MSFLQNKEAETNRNEARSKLNKADGDLQAFKQKYNYFIRIYRKPELVANVIGGFLENVKIYLPHIIDALYELNILEKSIFIGVIATIGTETGQFKPIHEYGTPEYFTKMYENRSDLGNIYPGDGAKYHGRGFIQITGRNNYNEYGKRFHIDLINNPDLALDPEISAKILAAYFVDRGVVQAARNEDWRQVRRLATR